MNHGLYLFLMKVLSLSNLSDTENTYDDETIIVSPESDPSFDCNRDIYSMRTSVLSFIPQIGTRYCEDPSANKQSIKCFLKSLKRIMTGNDYKIQKALFTFAKEVIWKRGKKKTSPRTNAPKL